MAVEKNEQKNIFQDFKTELNSFKEQIEKKASWESISIDVEKYEKSLWNGLKPLENNISDTKEKTKFLKIVNKLLYSTEQVDTQDIIFLEHILDWLESKELEHTDLEALKESIKQLSPTKSKLSKLKQTVYPKKTEIEETKKKIEKYKEKLKTFSKKHPIWTKALIMLLPASLVWLFKKKEENTKSSIWMWKFWDIINNLKWWFSFLNDWMAKIAIMFFSLPWIWAPKEMQELLAEMSNLKNVNPNILQHFWWTMKDIVKKNLEKTKEKDLKKATDWLNNMMKTTLAKYVEKISWKKINDKKVEKLIKEMNFKELLSWDTKNLKWVLKALNWKEYNKSTNALWAWIESITLPFKIFTRITSVLMRHDYVKPSDLWVYFYRKSKEIFFWTFGLLWSWVKLIKWKIDSKDFEEQVRELLDTEPTVWKQILAIMLYRHDWLIFSIIWSISKYIWKVIISSLTWESSVIANIKDSLRWEINEYVRVLQKIKKVAPDTVEWISIFRESIDKLDEVNIAIKIIKETPNLDWNWLIKKFEEQVWKKPKFLSFSGINSWDLKSALSNFVESIWWDLDTRIWKLEAYGWKMLKWIASEKFILDSVAKSIKQQTKYMSLIIKNDSFWNKLFSHLTKINYMFNVAEVDYINDKIVYKFKDPKNAKDFFKKLWILWKQSPELVRFLFDKMPIFAVAWLATMQANEKENFLLSLGKEISYLIPVFGSGFMLYDSFYLQEGINYTQATISWVLFTTETSYIAINATKGNFSKILNYIIKPWRDILEIASFVSKTVSHTWKISYEWFKLLKNWKVSKLELWKLLEKFPKLKWKLVLIWLMLFWTYEFAFAWDNKENEIIKKCKWDIVCLDKQIKKEWNNLDNETKWEFLSLALYLRTGYHWIIKYDNWSFDIAISKENKVIPNYRMLKDIQFSMQKIIEKRGSTNSIYIWLSQGIIENIKKRENLDTIEKIKDYFIARWYPDGLVEKFCKI